MKSFFDTSVLVAALWHDHPQHMPSLKLFSKARPSSSFCGTHSLAELYATLTALPVKYPIQPDQALLLIEQVLSHLTPVPLSTEHYLQTLTKAASAKLTSGRIYDALLLEAAVQSKADRIYTLNLKHFRAIAPALSSRILAPPVIQ